jgi:membrane fusion protein (multidrug efflux system)
MPAVHPMMAAAMAAVLVGCGRRGAETNAEARVGVTVQQARTETLRDVATASGTVVPSTAGDLTVYAPEPATIAELPKHENDPVAIGDLLVRFEIASVSQQLAAEELAVSEARAAAERANAQFARMTDLYNRGLAARNAYESARASQQAAQSVLGQATSQLEMVRVDAGRASVHASFAGRVLRVWHAEGDTVTGGQTDPVIRVVDPARVQVSVQLPVAQLARIVPGQAATIRAFDVEAPFAAVIATKRLTADADAPTGEVRLAFNEPTTLALDAPVSVEILLDQRAGVVVVPTEAVLRDNTSSFVVVAGTDGLAHRRDVRTGLSTRTLTQIATGLAAGERVIVGGLEDVAEGTPIAFAQP